MTWGVLETLLSVRGGYGCMLRSLGFTPDPRVDDIGFVQLIAGQPYLNLNLEARLDHRDIPYTVDVDRLERTPSLALGPRRDLMLARTPLRFWLRLPNSLWRVCRQSRRLRKLRMTYEADLTGRAFPAFAAEVRQARQVDLSGLANDALVARFQEWRTRTLVDFAAVALQPAVFAGLILHELVNGADDAEQARRLEHLRDVLAAVSRPVAGDQPAALHALLRGNMDLPTFLTEFGHRGPEELELAQPRWSEVPPTMAAYPSPKVVRPVAPADMTPLVERNLSASRVALAETARHYMMMGYSYLRTLLVELDHRFHLAGGIFFSVLKNCRPCSPVNRSLTEFALAATSTTCVAAWRYRPSCSATTSKRSVAPSRTPIRPNGPVTQFHRDRARATWSWRHRWRMWRSPFGPGLCSFARMWMPRGCRSLSGRPPSSWKQEMTSPTAHPVARNRHSGGRRRAGDHVGRRRRRPARVDARCGTVSRVERP